MAERPTTAKSLPAKRPTLRDVAERAGCSTAVVSMVVNKSRSSSGASEALVERVRKAAKELGYRPDFASRSLARRTTQTIGVYVPPDPWTGLGHVYEGEILHGIESACHDSGYDLMAINLSGGSTPESCIHRFTERRIDGLLLLHVGHYADWVGKLAQHHPHVVAVNYYGTEPKLSTINFDDQAAVRMAVEHLAALGHRRIAYLGNSFDPGPGGKLRRAGYEMALRDAGLEADPAWVVDWNTDWVEPAADRHVENDYSARGAEYLRSLGAQGPTALVAYNDHSAAEAMIHLLEHGVEIGAGMSIVGIDNSPACQFVRPALTTIRQPLYEMGRRAAQLVLQAAIAHRDGKRNSPLSEPVHELVAPELIARQSSAPPA